MALKKHTMSVATGAAIAAAGVLAFAPIAGAKAYPGATTSPGTVLLPTVNPTFTIPPDVASIILNIFGTTPSVVADVTSDAPPALDPTTAVGSITNPVDLSNATDNVTTLPVGGELYFSYSFGAAAANQVINTVIVLPGGETVEVVAHTDSTGRIVFKASVSDPHISINGSVPIPAHYGANTVTLAATYKGHVVTQNVTINVPQSASGGTPSTIAGGTTTSTGKPFIAEGLGIFALVIAGGALVGFGIRRRTKAGESA